MSGPRARIGTAAARFDRTVDGWFRRLRAHPLANRTLYLASEAGNFSLIWHALAWLPVLVAPSPRRLRRAAECSVALVAESVIVNGPIKSMFRRERPTLVVEDGLVTHRLRTPKTSSFPSGHASAAMVAAAMLGRDRAARPFVLLLAPIVSASRIHVRIHHASDVVGGMVIGALLGRIARRLLP